MCDGTLKAMSHTMKTDKKEVTATKEEEAATSEEEETTTEAEVEDEESTEDTESEKEEESKDEDKSEDSSSTDEELDLDAELEKERKAGEPDPVIAKERFKESEDKRKKESDDVADKPLTQKDLDAALAKDRKERQSDAALVLARGMAGSDKEAELIVAKWANRTFPKNLTLAEQIQEAYVITHAKKLVGERNEAMRALKGKQGVKKDAAGTHRDAAISGTEPKLPPRDAAAIAASGFTWNTRSRQYEKKLPNGRILVRDNKTKQVRLLKKGQTS